jgi:hypothetical protein
VTIQDEVKQLAVMVPGPPGEPLPPGLCDADIEGFFQRIGMTVSSELRDWLRYTNGPCIGPGGLFGTRPHREHLDMGRALLRIPEFRANGWLPLGTDDCGGYYVLTTGSGAVFFVDPHGAGYGAPTYAVASGLWPFLRFLFRRELGERRWPFDPAEVLAHDPSLADVRGAPLPWDAEPRRPA